MFRKFLLSSCLVVGAVAVLPVIPVAAHSWYPKRCCHDRDCFPAERMWRLEDGTLVLTHGAIFVRVAPGFPIEASPDGKSHFCVYESGFGHEPRCVFLPTQS